MFEPQPRFAETLHTLANEPSLGLYYVTDHVQRSVPNLVAGKQELCRLTELVKGADIDASEREVRTRAGRVELRRPLKGAPCLEVVASPHVAQAEVVV